MNSSDAVLQVILYSNQAPTKEQEERLIAFLTKKYQRTISLQWIQEADVQNGFRLVVKQDENDSDYDEVYDWSLEGRKQQLQDAIRHLAGKAQSVMPLLKETVESWSPHDGQTDLSQEVGHVLTVGDGIATVSGLPHVQYGEILTFASGIKGMVQNLKAKEIGCILFGDDEAILEGSKVKRTGKLAGTPVGEQYIGRVVNPLGAPLDGKGDIQPDDYFPLEYAAPGIIDRQPVNQPLQTGLLAIDSMFPIGRGQRELIIGDRQTGKTAIALDTILHQKDKDVLCIYVAIGQKASSVAQLTDTLRRLGAMDYTIVMCATAGDSAPLQYIAPYAGCSMGEYFMKQGKDVLIVYDDLSKHAIAYRTMSLLLERSPGREAYPGDVFYLHSRLLERSAHLSDALGGGSMTALPIVETQAGDVSAYIPTNIISITDGQIFLESSLFFAGQRPAVNVGISVSRVGGAAQTKAMKKAAGTIRLALAQYREIEVFTQFASDLDESTREQLQFGQGLMQLLKQEQHSPMSQQEQVLTLVVALRRLYRSVPVSRIREVHRGLLAHLQAQLPEVCHEITQNGQLSDEAEETIVSVAQAYLTKDVIEDAQSK